MTFDIGMRVKHSIFGTGSVIGIQDRTKKIMPSLVVVKFDHPEEKVVSGFIYKAGEVRRFNDNTDKLIVI